MNEADKKAKWMSTALVGSLALNLFVGGFLVSQALNGKKDAPDDMVFTADFSTLPVNMPESIRERVEDSMRDKRRELKRAYSDYSRQQRKINRLMREDEIDEDDLREAYEELAEIQTKIQIPIREAMIEATRMMDKETREAIIEVREREMPARIVIPKKLDGKRWKIDLEDEGFEIDVSRIIENSEDIQEIARQAAEQAERAVRDARDRYDDAKRRQKAQLKELRAERRALEREKRREARKERDKRREKRDNNDDHDDDQNDHDNENDPDVDVPDAEVMENRIQALVEKETRALKIEFKTLERLENSKLFEERDDYLSQFDFNYRTDHHNKNHR